jgi:hypothetical protein
MQFPNDIQCALLFEHRGVNLDAAVRTFLQIEGAKLGVRYNPVEVREGAFYQLFGTNDLMVTAEYIDGPANMEVFKPALSSVATRILFPEVAEALMTHKSHVLINIRSGAIPNLPEIAQLMAKIGVAGAGASLPQFLDRMSTCTLLSRIVMEAGKVSAVHWTQSDQILKPETFETMAGLEAPGPLNIHPFLFGREEDGKQLAGIRTFGARHFIGREIRIQPSELPWGANYEVILAFLRVATIDNGYVIPDGDTFGPEDRSVSYRVRHLDAEDGDVPFYELEPLMHREYGFQSEGYVPRIMAFDDRSAPSALMPGSSEDRAELVTEWREKRAMAEGIGGRFEVRPKFPGTGNGDPASTPPAPTSPPPRPVFGRKVFGRKV